MEEERAAAARAAAKECVRIILDGQAKEGGLETLNWQNKDGDTALIWAAEAGQAEIAQYLMEKGAPPIPPFPTLRPGGFRRSQPKRIRESFARDGLCNSLLESRQQERR